MRYNPEDVLIVRTEMPVKRERIADLLVGAFEGGSNYWLDAVVIDKSKGGWPDGCEYMSDVVASGLARWVFFTEDDREDIRHPENVVGAGLSLLAKEFPKQFELFLNEQDDAETSDIFFQLVCFGEVVYG